MDVTTQNGKYLTFLTGGEGYGLPVLEAMTAGVPVVASDTPALREVGGDAARYENPFDAAAWADAIAEALRRSLRIAEYEWAPETLALLEPLRGWPGMLEKQPLSRLVTTLAPPALFAE